MKKTVIITGASRGIGRAAALLFAKKGWQLAVCCRQNTALLHSLCEEASLFGAPCLAFQGDLGDARECDRFFREIQERYSCADVLINNAGISLSGLFQDMTPRQWQEILANNLSSVWGNVGAACEVAYSATKGGVSSLTKALAKELAPSHIRVNAVAFGAIDTDMNSFLSQEERQALLE